MPSIQVNLRFRGKVVLDSTKDNQISEGFILYVQQALEGKRPLILSYQIYEGFSGAKAQATISQTQKGINQFSITFTANFNNLNTQVVELYLQAVLTSGEVINIARVTSNFPHVIQTLTVTWTLVVEFTVYNPPGYQININGIYDLMYNFFVNPSSLTVSPPSLNVSYSPTSVPEYQGIDLLSFFVAFANFASGGLCPVVQYNITYYILGVPVLNLTGYFNCTPQPNILNYIFFSLNVS